ncbi:PREDICTED: peptidyl-prolyl cis-trans isomerase G-like [Ceratosolen solmsi marchali]|uniref:Peptidyl-prolyl cis-trans isomerase G-like n=1 Tax=Ceratosolen solmsi marchali TaxID=326594 RepID=A0AAJ7DU70_9HYME|nr:PREDICTED: peptidyl-prolyl cis-trans isomerase G-like [Ceratosolen solmsi marchali]
MAPMKRSHDSSAKNRDNNKTKRRKSPNDTSILYKCLGKLCGEECDEELLPVTDKISRYCNSIDRLDMDIGSDNSDDDLDDRERRSPGHMKGIRQLKPKKQSNLDFKLGVQKAKQYICQALNFGVQSGYLMLKDSKGQLLKVSSDLYQTTDKNKNYSIKCLHSGDADSTAERKQTRKRQLDSAEKSHDNCDINEARRNKSNKKGRSRSGRRSRRSGKSRSRSKRKHVKRRMVRSNSNNSEPEIRPKQTKTEEIEQDDLGTNNNAVSTNERNITGSNDDCKSIKSTKSTKSTSNSYNQTTTEDQKHGEDDVSNEDISDYDEKKK